MDTSLHIPWTNEALENLVREIINTGESTKVDFKSEWNISSSTQKAELARDIQAMANSFDSNYRNHGFLLLGARPGQLLSTPFGEDADKMQATVDQIVREYLGPFVPTQVRQFGGVDGRWGVIVILPSRCAPHVFLRDSAKYSRGDIWVRVGTTTAKADPVDFSRFFRVHLDDHGRELREELRELQRDVERLKASKPVAGRRMGRANTASSLAPRTQPESPDQPPTNVLEVIRRGLQKSVHPVSAALASEAAALRAFLETREIPWDLSQLSKESGRTVIEQLHEKASMFWKALAIVMEYDDGRHDADVFEALSALAFVPEAPTGTRFTRMGTAIRLYPLTMALYIVFVVALHEKRYTFLKHVSQLELRPRRYEEDPLPIGTALLYVRGAEEVFQTAREDYPERRWCDSIGTSIQRWFGSHLYTEIPSLERRAHFFYVGEFVLSLVAAAAENIARPASGVFYFASESAPILRRYLSSDSDALREIFGSELRTILERFDEWGPKIANSGRCWGDGFQRGAIQAVFPAGQADKGAHNDR